MSTEKTEKYKKKIKALLSKTVENGATEEEAMAAIEKADELMKAHFISLADLDDPFIDEKCEYQRIKFGQRESRVIIKALMDLFQTQAWWTSRPSRLTFFGFKEDVEMCVYFYDYINIAAKKAWDEYYYKDSEAIRMRSSGYNMRDVGRSFRVGFFARVSRRLREMLQERNMSMPSSSALVVVKKKDKVKLQKDALGLEFGEAAPLNTGNSYNAQLSGERSGAKVNLSRGISSAKNNSTRKLS